MTTMEKRIFAMPKCKSLYNLQEIKQMIWSTLTLPSPKIMCPSVSNMR